MLLPDANLILYNPLGPMNLCYSEIVLHHCVFLLLISMAEKTEKDCTVVGKKHVTAAAAIMLLKLLLIEKVYSASFAFNKQQARMDHFQDFD
jgi:hypothetical protein